MNPPWNPQDQVFWYLNRKAVSPCTQNLHAEVAIVGGGMAGLSAAHAFHQKGKRVVLLEQYYCGSGATGKSSGFITPNAELSLTDFAKRYDMSAAHTIWRFITSGVQEIRHTIKEHNFSCDYTPENTLVVANSKNALKALETEHLNLEKLGYKTCFYDAKSIQHHIGSSSYFGGVGYQDTFGINAYAYCQEMKKMLQTSGVQIFEETPVTAIHGHTLTTTHATITADRIIICADQFFPELGLLKQDVYHAQTFLMISQQLSSEQIKTLFPTDKLMVWDTDLIYTYFRITGDNRLLLGGGSLLTTYSKKAQHDYQPIINKLTAYLKQKFPNLNIQFEHVWPGLIGLSKDIAPIAGPDKHNKNIFYITAAAGLPIAAALGKYSAQYMLDGNDELDAYFSPYRSFPIGGTAQTILGNKLTFALSNLIRRGSS